MNGLKMTSLHGYVMEIIQQTQPIAQLTLYSVAIEMATLTGTLIFLEIELDLA